MSAALDFSAMDFAGAAELLSALRDELAERARACRTDDPAERSRRTVLCTVLRQLGEAEDGLRKADAATARTELSPAPNRGPQQLMAPVLPMVPRHPVEALPDSLRDPRVARGYYP